MPAGAKPSRSKSRSKSASNGRVSALKDTDVLKPGVPKKRRQRARNRRKFKPGVTFAEQVAVEATPPKEGEASSAIRPGGSGLLRQRDPTPVRPKTSIVKVPTAIHKAPPAVPKGRESPLPALNWGFSDSPGRARKDGSASPRVDAQKRKRSASRSPRERGKDRTTDGQAREKGKGRGKGFNARSKGKGKQRSRSKSSGRKGGGAARKDGGAVSAQDRRG